MPEHDGAWWSEDPFDRIDWKGGAGKEGDKKDSDSGPNWLSNDGNKNSGNMKKRRKPPVIIGVMCPACSDRIFSLHVHDFRRCKCGKVFVDGGSDCIRYGAEPPVDIDEVVSVYENRKEAERLMSESERSKLPLPPPPLSYTTRPRRRLEISLSWDNILAFSKTGPVPSSGSFIGSIYKWAIAFGPLRIRRWPDT